jgi:Fe2+ transport system protein FeoA
VTGWAPFGDPLTLTARGSHLSLRASEARCVSVRACAAETTPSRRAR